MTSSSEIDFQITNSCKNTADKKETYKNDKCDKGRYFAYIIMKMIHLTFQLSNDMFHLRNV